MRKDKISNVFKVAQFLIENPEGSYIRELSKELNMPVGTVANSLSFISVFLIRDSIAEKVDMPLPKLPVFYRIKEGTTLETIRRFVDLKASLHSI